MTWFEELTGFEETEPDRVRQQITIAGETMTSLANGKTYTCGRLETPSLGELRDRLVSVNPKPGRLAVREVVANVSDLHADIENTGCLFQVASQFNLLEMVDPNITPEYGVGIYERDRTQGPACAVAAGAGTIYRNYFAVANDRIGQSADNQIDCLADLGRALGNVDGNLWEMRNGYALASREGLVEIAKKLSTLSENERDRLRQLLRVGIQWNTQVTARKSKHAVTQVYCSALPVAYGRSPHELWEDFARLVLEAAYEATFCTAALNAANGGSDRAFLTLLGGGAFGNRNEWIADAIARSLERYADWDLDVAIVSFGRSKPHVRELIEKFSSDTMQMWEP